MLSKLNTECTKTHSVEPRARALCEAPVVGNAYSDGDLWRGLYDYAQDKTNPLDARASVIRKMDELTGEPESKGKDDATLVADYERELAKLEAAERPSRAVQDVRQTIANLEDGAVHDPDPEHRVWCFNMLKEVRAYAVKKGIDTSNLPAPRDRSGD